MGETPARVYVQDLFDKNHEYVGFSHCFTCARKAKEELEARIRELEARLRDRELQCETQKQWIKRVEERFTGYAKRARDAEARLRDYEQRYGELGREGA